MFMYPRYVLTKIRACLKRTTRAPVRFVFWQLVFDPLAIDPAVWGYMRRKRLYGFNRQPWLKRVVDATVPGRTMMRSLMIAGTAGFLVALGLGAALIATGHKRGKSPPKHR